MIINLNVKVKGGQRTPPSVECYYTAVNEKVIEFANGTMVTGTELAEWIASELLRSLNKRAGIEEASDV